MAFKLTVDGRSHEVEIVRRRPHLVVRIDGREHEVSLPATSATAGRRSRSPACRCTSRARIRATSRSSDSAGRTFEASLVDPRADAEAGGGGQDHVKAPMPGAGRLGAQGGRRRP